MSTCGCYAFSHSLREDLKEEIESEDKGSEFQSQHVKCEGAGKDRERL